MENFERKTSPKNGIDTENWFLESYRRYKGHPIRILIALYKGNYHKFVMAVICFFIKHACVWVLPISRAALIQIFLTVSGFFCVTSLMIFAVMIGSTHTQMFLSILNIALNIGVALVVTASKSKIVFVFFLLKLRLRQSRWFRSARS